MPLRILIFPAKLLFSACLGGFLLYNINGGAHNYAPPLDYSFSGKNHRIKRRNKNLYIKDKKEISGAITDVGLAATPRKQGGYQMDDIHSLSH